MSEEPQPEPEPEPEPEPGPEGEPTGEFAGYPSPAHLEQQGLTLAEWEEQNIPVA